MPRFRLHQPHTHAGIDHAAGAVIEVEPDIAEWLIARQAGEIVVSLETPSADTSEATALPSPSSLSSTRNKSKESFQ